MSLKLFWVFIFSWMVFVVFGLVVGLGFVILIEIC